MKPTTIGLGLWCVLAAMACAQISIDEESFGTSLGGWKKKEQYSEYSVSGTLYRTYRPECTITPDGGLYVSVRIDHVRGWFSSDDHAVLEISIDRMGHIASAQSNIAIQGRSISSDVIEGVNKAGTHASGIDRAVQIGSDLVADLSSKLLRTKLVEPGRVSYPSAVRHNYNLLYQAIRVTQPAIPAVPAPQQTSSTETPKTAAQPAATPEMVPVPAGQVDQAEPLMIKAYTPPAAGTGTAQAAGTAEKK